MMQDTEQNKDLGERVKSTIDNTFELFFFFPAVFWIGFIPFFIMNFILLIAEVTEFFKK